MSLNNFHSPKNLTKRLLDLLEEHADDPEVFHIRADAALCRVLENLGYGEAVEIFQRASKWYA